MSDYDYDDNDQSNGPKALRELVEKLQKELKEQGKTLEAERAEKATLSAQVKKSSLASLLKAAGVPEKFAARADKDGADASEDGVKAWIEENKDFYNFGVATAPVVVADPDGAPNVSAELEQALRASQSLDASGVTPSEVNVTERIQSIPDNISEADLLKQLADLGVGIA
jgi:hypothetical protein